VLEVEQLVFGMMEIFMKNGSSLHVPEEGQTPKDVQALVLHVCCYVSVLLRSPLKALCGYDWRDLRFAERCYPIGAKRETPWQAHRGGIKNGD